MNKKNLYCIAALIWGIPGIIITIKGIRTYLTMAPQQLWWLQTSGRLSRSADGS